MDNDNEKKEHFVAEEDKSLIPSMQFRAEDITKEVKTVLQELANLRQDMQKMEMTPENITELIKISLALSVNMRETSEKLLQTSGDYMKTCETLEMRRDQGREI